MNELTEEHIELFKVINKAKEDIENKKSLPKGIKKHSKLSEEEQIEAEEWRTKKFAEYIKEEFNPKEEEDIPLPKTETINGIVKFYINAITNYEQLARHVFTSTPFFYDQTGIWWFWNLEKFKWEITNDIDILILVKKVVVNTEAVIRNKKLVDSLMIVGRENRPKEAPIHWIQFKHQIFDLYKRDIVSDATPEYFFTNPIPWELGDPDDTPTIDNLFTQWVGADYVETLYESIAYCCLRDYPIHTLICLNGSGRNGKGQFTHIIERFIGKDNVCSAELDHILNSKFETFKMYKKLACFMSETNYTVQSKTSMLKKLCGGDLISFEKKGKDSIDEYNYAKIILSTNALPPNEDNTDGWYSRWIIIDFPNQFKEQNKPIINTIPLKEYSNLAAKVVRILPNLIERGIFTNQGTIDERKEKYLRTSNPLISFLEEFAIDDPNGYVLYSDLYKTYSIFLLKRRARVPSKREFSRILETMSIETKDTTKQIDGEKIRALWVLGYMLLKKDIPISMLGGRTR